MAKYTITQKCGCVKTINVVGSCATRQQRADWVANQNCYACQAKINSAVKAVAPTEPSQIIFAGHDLSMTYIRDAVSGCYTGECDKGGVKTQLPVRDIKGLRDMAGKMQAGVTMTEVL